MQLVSQNSTGTAVNTKCGTNYEQHLSAQITVEMLTLGKDIFMHKLFCKRNITGSETARLSVMRMSSAFALVTAAFKGEKKYLSSYRFPSEVNKKKKTQVIMVILRERKNCLDPVILQGWWFLFQKTQKFLRSLIGTKCNVRRILICSAARVFNGVSLFYVVQHTENFFGIQREVFSKHMSLGTDFRIVLCHLLLPKSLHVLLRVQEGLPGASLSLMASHPGQQFGFGKRRWFYHLSAESSAQNDALGTKQQQGRGPV